MTTLDHEVLYAWHVLPLNVYEKHEPDLALAASGSPDGDFTQTQAFQLLAKDPKARLVINCKSLSSPAATTLYLTQSPSPRREPSTHPPSQQTR